MREPKDLPSGPEHVTELSRMQPKVEQARTELGRRDTEARRGAVGRSFERSLEEFPQLAKYKGFMDLIGACTHGKSEDEDVPGSR